MKMFNMNRFYELISAFQKSIRWCEINNSRYFAQELMDMGYPGAVLNRLILIAAEDVGLADPSLVEYERKCSDSFENLIKQDKIKKRDAVNCETWNGAISTQGCPIFYRNQTIFLQHTMMRKNKCKDN